MTPADGLNSSGTQGGPFSPPRKNYTLQNTGGSSLDWTASKGAAWTTLSSASGTLAAGASTTVTVTINGNANNLPAGSYTDTVSFTNATNGSGNTTRPVSLTVIPTPVSTDLVAYYPFTGDANDASGNGLHGAVNGAILTTDRYDIANRAYQFDGVNDGISVAHNALLNIRSQISLVAWIYPTETKTQTIVRKGNYAPYNLQAYSLALSATGFITFQATVNGEFFDLRTEGYSLNRWSFIVGTYDGNAMRLYVNGALKTTSPVTGQINTNDRPLLIGTRLYSVGDTWKGKLDAIRIYSKALTGEEIALLQNEP